MVSPVRLAVPLAALLLLAGGCATTPRADVTRFHQGAALAPGAVHVVVAPDARLGALEGGAYARAVADALGRAGFAAAGSAAVARYVATVRVDEEERPQLARRGSGLSIGVGGGFGGRNVGVGGSVAVPVGQRREPPRAVATTLSVMLAPAPGGQTLWEGRAQADGPAAAVAPALADALFRDFPGPSGRTMQVALRPAGAASSR